MAANWESPLTITTPHGQVVIGSAEDAIHFMETEWPANRGYLYDLAKRKCEKNLTDQNAWNAARLAFRGALSAIEMFPNASPAVRR